MCDELKNFLDQIYTTSDKDEKQKRDFTPEKYDYMNIKQQKGRSMEKIFFKTFHIAGFTYYNGVHAFSQLKIGSLLELKYEENNKHDDFAVALYFENKKIGYIPKSDNKSIAKILASGYPIFEAVVQQLLPDEHPEQQVRVAVFVIPKK